jgi:hypothetical protein
VSRSACGRISEGTGTESIMMYPSLHLLPSFKPLEHCHGNVPQQDRKSQGIFVDKPGMAGHCAHYCHLFILMFICAGRFIRAPSRDREASSFSPSIHHTRRRPYSDAIPSGLNHWSIQLCTVARKSVAHLDHHSIVPQQRQLRVGLYGVNYCGYMSLLA